MLAKLSRPPLPTQPQPQPHSESPNQQPQLQPSPFRSQTDILFIGTDRATYFTVSWDQKTNNLRTERKYVDLADPSARESQLGDRCLIDPSGRFLTLELYEGIVTVIPIGQPLRSRGSGRKLGKRAVNASANATNVNQDAATADLELGEPCQARVEELLVRSSTFLHTQADTLPRMALLYEDTMGKVRLKVRELEVMHGGMGGATGGGGAIGADGGSVAVLKGLDLLKEELEMGASFLVPVPAPLGRFLLVFPLWFFPPWTGCSLHIFILLLLIVYVQEASSSLAKPQSGTSTMQATNASPNPSKKPPSSSPGNRLMANDGCWQTTTAGYSSSCSS